MLLPILIFLLFLTLPLLLTHLSGAIWSPTPPSVARRMLELARVKPGEIVYDLGCGDGRMAILAAKEFGARAIGIEINPILLLLARIKGRGIPNLELRWGNVFKADLSDADVVVTYFSPQGNRRLTQKLLQLERDVRVVSYRWKLGLRLEKKEGMIFLYKTAPPSEPSSLLRTSGSSVRE
ncbi:MAG: methyltransferase domain-containing protein [Candidatus Hadarchaeales archaeon]